MSGKNIGYHVYVKGTNLHGKSVGKGYAEIDGKLQEVDVLEIDTSRVTLTDLRGFMKLIVVSSHKVIRK